MSIASLINVPKTQREWDSWSFTHKIQHDNINRAILAKKNKSLTPYVLDPINQDAPDTFLQNNSQMHIDICDVLNVEGSDLTNINWQDAEEIGNWIYLHWQEHSNFNAALGI
jgi:hypothetical protein